LTIDNFNAIFDDSYSIIIAINLTGEHSKGFWGKTEINGTRIRFIPVWYI